MFLPPRAIIKDFFIQLYTLRKIGIGTDSSCPTDTIVNSKGK